MSSRYWPKKSPTFSAWFETYINAGKAATEKAEAEKSFRDALALMNQEGNSAADGLDPRLAVVFHYLAALHGENGAFGVMARGIDDARETESKLAYDQLHLADCLERLGRLYFALTGKTNGIGSLAHAAQGRSRWPWIAESLHRRTLAIRERTVGPDHILVADSLEEIIRAAGDWGRTDKPTVPTDPVLDSAFARMLRIREKVLGPEHPDVADSLEICAQHLSASDAKPLLERALRIREAVFGSRHPEVARSMELLAKSSEEDGREKFLLDALTIREEIQGRRHPDVAGTLSLIFNCYEGQEKFKQANEALERSVEIFLDAVSSDYQDGHDSPELIEFVLSPSSEQFNTFERVSVTERAAHRIRLVTGELPNSSMEEAEMRTRESMAVEDVLGQPVGPRSFDETTMSKLADTLVNGYSWLWDQKGWPRECYQIEDLVDPLRYGLLSAGWVHRLIHFKEIVRRGPLHSC